MLTHLSLFSGIGGLDLAAEAAGFRTVGQCEWADYPTKVLEKHWPEVPRWRDIRTLTKESFYERTGLRTCDVISGGFPCQPHSVAGKRLASHDERDLWPEMRRVIGEIEPEWVVGENVRGLLSSEDGRFFRGILRDFAKLGYDVGWGVTSAAAVGAVHRRSRVAIIAHSNRKSVERIRLCHRQKFPGSENGGEKIWNPTFAVFKQLRSNFRCLYAWNEEPIKPLITRADDGFLGAMDRLKCLGNAVVPAQFYPIFKGIAYIAALRGGEKRQPLEKPVEIRFYWDDGLDVDNHAVLGKAIVDAMKKAVIVNDDRRYVEKVSHEFWDGGEILVEVKERYSDGSS